MNKDTAGVTEEAPRTPEFLVANPAEITEDDMRANPGFLNNFFLEVLDANALAGSPDEDKRRLGLAIQKTAQELGFDSTEFQRIEHGKKENDTTFQGALMLGRREVAATAMAKIEAAKQEQDLMVLPIYKALRQAGFEHEVLTVGA